jgi:hypothetical protein
MSLTRTNNEINSQEYKETINYYEYPPDYTELYDPPAYSRKKNKFDIKNLKKFMNIKMLLRPPKYSQHYDVTKTRKNKKNKSKKNNINWPFHERARSAGLLVFG